MVVTPFDRIASVDFAPAGQTFAPGITQDQWHTLRSMALEKAELVGKDLTEADDLIDTWLGDMSRATASGAIRKLGRWLDDERRRRGITTTVRSNR